MEARLNEVDGLKRLRKRASKRRGPRGVIRLLSGKQNDSELRGKRYELDRLMLVKEEQFGATR